MKPERIERNDFEHLTNWMVNGARVPVALRIWCSHCGRNEVYRVNGGVHTISQSIAERVFKQKGWVLGRRRKNDICPDCVKADRDERNAKRIAQNAKTDPTIADIWPSKPVAPASNVIPIKKETPALASTPFIKPEPPRTMTLADRRLIIGAIDEHYIDENQGYEAGWNDQKIATDLGVPVAWVRQLREENFGQEGLSADARAVIEETKKALAEISAAREAAVKAYSETQERFLKEHNAIVSRLTTLAESVSKKLARVEKGQL